MSNHPKFPALRIAFAVSLVAACHGLSAQETRSDSKPARATEMVSVHLPEVVSPARAADGIFATTKTAQPSRDFDFDVGDAPASQQLPARDFDFDLGE